jgi:hypothetical protein
MVKLRADYFREMLAAVRSEYLLSARSDLHHASAFLKAVTEEVPP